MATLWNDGSSDSDIGDVKLNKNYADRYDSWRKSEVLQKLKDRYKDEDLSGTSSSEEDEEALELTDEVEQSFFRTLSSLKNKDPKIYDKKVHFFGYQELETESSKEQKIKSEPLFLRDYERKLILEREGTLSDEECDNKSSIARIPTNVEEEIALKESLKKALHNSSDEEDEDMCGLFKKHTQSKEDKAKDEKQYREWLKGQKAKLEDKQVEAELKGLHNYWTDPKLAEDEKYLRDYILNKRFLEKPDNPEEEFVDFDQLSEDERAVEAQEEFEHKYNFRFEEPDQEFIKRFPRVMENSLRHRDDKRKKKRDELKKRKEDEKQRKFEEIELLKELKRKEIEEKVHTLKKLTGNDELGIKNEDIEGDFDPDEHDRRMQELFNKEFYSHAEDEKPQFPELDEELGIEDWDNWEVNATENCTNDGQLDDLHCEDPNFIMDCDYSPQKVKVAKERRGRSRRFKGHKQTALGVALSRSKPSFDPAVHNSFQQYVDQYYGLDCEDFVGDMPCRFKYRRVVPNSFGLSVEEILGADPKELNRWSSLKKTYQLRTEHVEKNEVKVYEQKAKNVILKKKILPSLYSNTDTSGVLEDDLKGRARKEDVVYSIENSKKRKTYNSIDQINDPDTIIKRKKKKRKKYLSDISSENDKTPLATAMIIPIHSNKKDLDLKIQIQTSQTNELKTNRVEDVNRKGKKNKNVSVIDTTKSSFSKLHQPGNKGTKKQWNAFQRKKGTVDTKMDKHSTSNDTIGISDARLKAYGIKPKKFKNSLLYGSVNKK